MLHQNAYTSWSFPQGGFSYLVLGHKGAPSASIRLCTRGDNDHKHASASPPDNTPSQAIYGLPPDPVPLAWVDIRSRIRALTCRQPNTLRYRPHFVHASRLEYGIPEMRFRPALSLNPVTSLAIQRAGSKPFAADPGRVGQ